MDDSIFIKILVVGDSGAGKTSILNQYCHNKFDKNLQPTIGSDFSCKIFNDYEGREVKLQLWDISGSLFFNNITSKNIL